MIPALILLSSKSEPDVVYCARTYVQGKAKSHYSMYLCRHDGTDKRLISRPNEVVTAATWIDDHTIGYLRLKESYGEFDNIDKYHGTICSLDLKTGRRRDLKQVLLDRPTQRTFQWRSVLSINGTDFALSRRGISSAKQSKEFDFGIGKDLPPGQEFSQFADVSTSSGSARIEWVRSFYEDPKTQIKVRIKLPHGKAINLWLLGGDIDKAFVLDQKMFLQTRLPGTQHDRSTFIHQIDCVSGASKVVVSGVGDNIFTPNKAIWLANENNNYKLELLDDGRAVHVDHLYSGNWKTGQRWTITGKLTDVVSASLK